MSKKDILQKIKNLDNLTPNEKAYLVELINAKKYGLVWENKPEAVEELLRQNLPILKEVKEKYIKGTNTTQISQNDLFPITENINNTQIPNHILIEGDNLHALTALAFTHENKIDVIYIDPPYNTGNKDFKYNDSFVDKEDTYRHSKWLSFMSKRLQIAKKLLSQNGVIFISIDDNEQSQLKLLCDEIFGEVNSLPSIIWHKKTQPSFLSKEIINVTEFILAYKKSNIIIPFKGSFTDSNKDIELLNSPNQYGERIFDKEFINIGNNWSGTLEKGEYGNGELKSTLRDDYKITDGKPDKDFVVWGRYKWGQTKINDTLKSGATVFFKSIKTLRATLKIHNAEDKIKPPINLISKYINDAPTNTDATNELKDIFDGISPMDYPKPTKLISFLLDSLTFENKNAIILDFFAGSGTTLHATMQLNAEDGGNRQCILVTNNENNICEEVTYERNKRVIEGYTNAKGVFVEGLGANNLRYYQCGFVSSEKTEQNKRQLTQASSELLSIKENCFEDITVVSGFLVADCQIFTNNFGKYLVIVYYSRRQMEVCERLVDFIRDLKVSERVKVYGFSPEREVLEDDFEKVLEKIEAIPLPEAIYNAYRATFKLLDLDRESTILEEDPSANESGLFDNLSNP